MKNLAFWLLVLFSLIACNKDDLSNNSSDLIGKWSWIESCPGLGYSGCWSPDSFYQAYDIVFDPDSTYSVFHLDTLKSSCKFHTFKFLNDQNHLVYLIRFESGSTDMYLVSNDTLHMTNSEGVVTITSRYKRIK
jgi:hypothetical protein